MCIFQKYHDILLILDIFFHILLNIFDTCEIDEGFVKGNLFRDEYDSYKNYKPVKITVQNEQDALLVKLMMLDFAINDLNLY